MADEDIVRAYEEKLDELETDLQAVRSDLDVLRAENQGLSTVKDVLDKMSPDHFAGSFRDALGYDFENINDSLQQLIQVNSAHSSAGKENMGIMGVILGSAVGDRISRALPMHGAKAFESMTTAALGIKGIFNKIDRLSPLAVAGEGVTVGISAWEGFTKLNQAMMQSGALTGQGAGAGYGQLTKAIEMGWQNLINPHSMLSMQFANEIIGTFRSAGFKDSLAYSLSNSVGNMTKQIGETMTKQMLPTITEFATVVGNQTVNLDNYSTNVSQAVSDLTSNIKILQGSSASTNASAPENLAIFSSLLNTISQTGFVNQTTATQLKDFTTELTSKMGFGLTPSPGNPNALGRAVSSLAQSGMLSRFTGLTPQTSFSTPANQKATLAAFPQLFEMFAQQMETMEPASFWKSHPDQVENYISQRLMPFLNSIPGFAGTMRPADVYTMIMKAIGGANFGVLEKTASIPGELPQEAKSLLKSIPNYHIFNQTFDPVHLLPEDRKKSEAQIYLDHTLPKKIFDLILKDSKLKDAGTISYQDFSKAFLKNPNMNIGQWLEAEAFKSRISRDIIPTFQKEHLPGNQINQINKILNQFVKKLEDQVVSNNMSNQQFSRETDSVISVINNFNGKGAVKGLMKDIQTIIKQNGKTVTNKSNNWSKNT